jgi:spectinomycin phosphotransferase
LRTRPTDILDDDLTAQVSQLWGLDVVEMDYVPVGGGTHHWRIHEGSGQRYWLNVDDLDNKAFLGAAGRGATYTALRRALDTAEGLRAAGLEFVVAPVPSHDGACLERFEAHYAVAVYPFLKGSTYAFDARLPPLQRGQVLQMLSRLHAATPQVREIAPEWRLALALRRQLEAALDDCASHWSGGPFSESARALIAAQAGDVRGALLRFDALVTQITETTAASDLVVTHGEPHPGNLLFGERGELHLVDWDTVALAPPERDLWLVRGFDGDANPEALELYRLRWRLYDTASFLDTLRAPHVETADTRHALRALEESLAMLGPGV